jgi:hypothetical protein
VLRGGRIYRKDPLKRHILGASKRPGDCPVKPPCEHLLTEHSRRSVGGWRCDDEGCPCGKEEGS